MKNKILIISFLAVITACTAPEDKKSGLSSLKISENKHYIVDENKNPFFWLGDTGWLLFKKLNREDAERYLEDRKQKGFKVIQVMVLHDINNAFNVYVDSALINRDITNPLKTEGSSFSNQSSYDFWDHVDYIIKLAEEKGLYMALVLWGSNVKNNAITPEQATIFGQWIANRYKNRSNIIWLNGGDTFGDKFTEVWQALGKAINSADQNHLQTFHPRGRMQSSMWFHNEDWLDFNMIQSGHRRYDQDDTELNYGEDNWRYIETDYNLKPTKPTLDGEPSYEGIPQGLHDTLQPFWNDDDVRRYAYWSVFAGACGFTYGHNAIMQFYKSGEKDPPAYGAKIYWKEALNAPGAKQMKYLKELMLSKPYLERIPDQSLIAKEQGEKYDYLIATRGESYAFIYTYTGRIIPVQMGIIKGDKAKASWFNPRNGELKKIGEFENNGIQEFMPPGGLMNGNDWVLVLDSILQNSHSLSQ
jgi:hypothetical protein